MFVKEGEEEEEKGTPLKKSLNLQLRLQVQSDDKLRVPVQPEHLHWIKGTRMELYYTSASVRLHLSN